MSILNPAGLTATAPVCDALDLTFPREYSLEVDEAMRHFLVSAYGTCDQPGVWRVPRVTRTDAEVARAGFQRVPVVKLDEFGQVKRVSFSGGTCDTFRKLRMWDEMLATLHQFPHRLTRLDATLDMHDLDGPKSVEAVTALGREGLIALGRKRIKPQDVQEHRSLDARGQVTGTVYLGKPTAEIRGKVYDKRHELESLGCADPGQWVRAEITLRKVNATLRDASQPGAIFWNYSGDVVTPPADAPSWLAGDTGYALPPRVELDAWQALRKGVEGWIEHLRALASLSDKLGPYGRPTLLNLLADAIGCPRPAPAYVRPS